MAKSYKTSIEFGLVYIPIDLYACVKTNDVGFNMLYKKTKERIKYKKTCENCPAQISPKDIIKGYEYEKGKYVTLTDEELEKIKTKKDKTIAIEKFVSLSEIDAIFFDKSYYVVPTSADKAYKVLCKAMESENKVAISKTVLGSKEQVVAIRVISGQMILYTLHFYDEIQANPIRLKESKISKEEVTLAKQVIENMASKFNAEEYTNEYREKVMKAIESKVKGETIKGKREKKTTNVINLMDALKKSVKLAEEKPAKKKPSVVKMEKRA